MAQKEQQVKDLEQNNEFLMKTLQLYVKEVGKLGEENQALKLENAGLKARLENSASVKQAISPRTMGLFNSKRDDIQVPFTQSFDL